MDMISNICQYLIIKNGGDLRVFPSKICHMVGWIPGTFQPDKWKVPGVGWARKYFYLFIFFKF